MTRSVTLPSFSSWLPEPDLTLDREPIRTRLPFRSHNNNTEEDPTMNKTEFVTYCIQHSEDFPGTVEITLDTARSVVGNIDPDFRIPEITPEEFRSLWNQLVHDPSVMGID